MLFVACSAEAGDRRVAFVVGNGDYKSVAQLPNPKNDADAVAAALKRQGFEVVTAIDIDRVTFDKAFEKFVRSMDNADLSVFYYSGHGIQVNGENRIIPVDAKLANPADLEIETVSVQTIMSYMRTNSKVQLVYLDSCRNNPFPSQSFLVGPEKQVAVAGVGLAPLANSLGSLVAFSTQPGAVAVDGTGDKSPFTESMLRHSFKLGVDAQTVAGLLDAAFKDIAHTELLADLGQIDGAALECEGRGRGDHEKDRDARQRCDQIGHDPVYQIVLACIARQVGEGQHRERGLVRQR